MAKQPYDYVTPYNLPYEMPPPPEREPVERVQPLSGTVIALENVGGPALLLAALCTFALFMSWMEFGVWNDVLTIGGLGVLALIAVGTVLWVAAGCLRRHERGATSG